MKLKHCDLVSGVKTRQNDQGRHDWIREGRRDHVKVWKYSG